MPVLIKVTAWHLTLKLLEFCCTFISNVEDKNCYKYVINKTIQLSLTRSYSWAGISHHQWNDLLCSLRSALWCVFNSLQIWSHQLLNLCANHQFHTEIHIYCCQHQQQQAIFSKLQGICACVYTGVYMHVQAWRWRVTRFCWSERCSGDTAAQLKLDTVDGTSATNATMTSTWAELERAIQVFSPYLADLDGCQANKGIVNDRWCVKGISK